MLTPTNKMSRKISRGHLRGHATLFKYSEPEGKRPAFFKVVIVSFPIRLPSFFIFVSLNFLVFLYQRSIIYDFPQISTKLWSHEKKRMKQRDWLVNSIDSLSNKRQRNSFLYSLFQTFDRALFSNFFLFSFPKKIELLTLHTCVLYWDLC